MAVTSLLLLLGSCSALRLGMDQGKEDPCMESMEYLSSESGCQGGGGAPEFVAETKWTEDTWTAEKCRACVDKAFVDVTRSPFPGFAPRFHEKIPALCKEKHYVWCDRPDHDEENFVWHDLTGQSAFCYQFYGTEEGNKKKEKWGKSNKAFASGLEYAKNCVGEDDGLMGFLKMQKESEYISDTSKFVASGGRCSEHGFTERVTHKDPFYEMSAMIFQRPGTPGVPKRFVNQWVNHECNDSPKMEMCHPSWSKNAFVSEGMPPGPVTSGFPCHYNHMAPKADDEEDSKPEAIKFVLMDQTQGWCFEAPKKQYLKKCVVDHWQLHLSAYGNAGYADYFGWEQDKIYASPPGPSCSQASYKTDGHESGSFHINKGPQPWAPEVTMWATPYGNEHFYVTRMEDVPDLNPLERPEDGSLYALKARIGSKAMSAMGKNPPPGENSTNRDLLVARQQQKCPYSG